MKKKLLKGLLLCGAFVLGVLAAEKARKIKLGQDLDKLLEELKNDDDPLW